MIQSNHSKVLCNSHLHTNSALKEHGETEEDGKQCVEDKRVGDFS